MRLPGSYLGLWKALSQYWDDYGGWGDFLSSPLLHFSALISVASYAEWTTEDWIDLPLALLPNLLGFSLGAYALIFSLADERLLAALNVEKPDGSPTALRMINATFLHFILFQTVAIIFAIVNKSSFLIDCVGLLPIASDSVMIGQLFLLRSAGFIGYFLTIYAVLLLIGAALAVYRLAIMSGRAASLAQQNRPNAPPSMDHDRSENA